MSVSLIHDLVRSGRMTPADGALLIEFRRELAHRRRPWWVKAVEVLARAVFV